MYRELHVAVVIPALNEESSIGQVVDSLPPWVDEVVVCDNGSTDRTAQLAADHGARVVLEARRGYGSACLAGLAALDSRADVVVFVDADFSDDPSRMSQLLDPLIDLPADLVIGSRLRGACEPGALTLPQQFGNRLACLLIRRIWGTKFTDLGPFRAIRREAMERLAMDDRDFGWTVQMQARAARMGLRCSEVPVTYRRRVAGRSKISGTLAGIWRAGAKILATILAEALRPGGRRQSHSADPISKPTRKESESWNTLF